MKNSKQIENSSDEFNKKYIALYITPQAKAVCARLKTLYGKRLTVKAVKQGTLRETFKATMRYDGIIAVMAAGIVVRGIAPFLKDKAKDPAVAALDEKGKFVVSLLSGHVGGANRLTEEIAKKLGAQAVITTASDVNNLPALDVYAKDMGYTVGDKKLYTKLVMAMVNGEKIGVYLEPGEPAAFFKHPRFKLFRSEKQFLGFPGKKLAVTYRNFSGIISRSPLAPCPLPLAPDVLYFIPRRLVVGLGFHRGMAGDEMLHFLKGVFERNGLFIDAVKRLATIDKRRDELVFASVCVELGAMPVFFTKTQIEEVEGLHQSETVKKYHGVGNISEACAYLGSGRGKIIIPKQKGGNITVCVALEKYSS